MPLEDYNAGVQQEGLVTNKAVSFGGTLAVTGLSTLASLAVTTTLMLTGALTASTGTFSGLVTANATVSSSQFFSGNPSTAVGLTSGSVSSAPIKINAIPGEKITASSTTKIGGATSTIDGIGGITF